MSCSQLYGKLSNELVFIFVPRCNNQLITLTCHVNTHHRRIIHLSEISNIDKIFKAMNLSHNAIYCNTPKKKEISLQICVKLPGYPKVSPVVLTSNLRF